MIIVSAQVLWVLTLGLWTLDLGLTISLRITIHIHLQDVESAITASRSARDEALNTRQRIESDLASSSSSSKLAQEVGPGAPAYYGLASTARRESRDLDAKVRPRTLSECYHSLIVYFVLRRSEIPTSMTTLLTRWRRSDWRLTSPAGGY